MRAHSWAASHETTTRLPHARPAMTGLQRGLPSSAAAVPRGPGGAQFNGKQAPAAGYKSTAYIAPSRRQDRLPFRSGSSGGAKPRRPMQQRSQAYAASAVAQRSLPAAQQPEGSLQVRASAMLNDVFYHFHNDCTSMQWGQLHMAHASRSLASGDEARRAWSSCRRRCRAHTSGALTRTAATMPQARQTCGSQSSTRSTTCNVALCLLLILTMRSRRSCCVSFSLMDVRSYFLKEVG